MKILKIIIFFMPDQNCHSHLHQRERAARAAHYLIYFTSYLTVFSGSSHLIILTKSIQRA